MNLDLYIFNLINGLAGKWKVLDFLGIFFAEYLPYILVFCLILFLVSDFKKYGRMVFEALLAAVFVRLVLVEIIYRIWFRARPFVENKVNLLISYDPHMSSFPSGHASFFFALSTIIFGYNKKAGFLFFIASFLIVLARVFVGVHWPSDILAGAVLGVVAGLLLNKIFQKTAPL